jgi:hypothetical protein
MILAVAGADVYSGASGYTNADSGTRNSQRTGGAVSISAISAAAGG